MSVKELNRDDLLNRFASHTFDETTSAQDPDLGDMTLVEFKDGSDIVVGSAKKLVVDDAYRAIRVALVGDASVLLRLTEVQRDALSSTVDSTIIHNTDATVEIFNESSWEPA